MKHKKILFVCSGNTCRSPMAEAVLRDELKKRKIKWYTVRSAGIDAVAQNPMNDNAKAVLKEMNIPFSETFVSRRLTKKMIQESEVVICMTEQQGQTLSDFPNVTSMTYLTGRDIPDPYGQGISAYYNTLLSLQILIPRIADVVCVPNE